MQQLTWHELLERALPGNPELVRQAANALEEEGFDLAHYVVEDVIAALPLGFKRGQLSACRAVLQQHQAGMTSQEAGK